MSDTPVIQVRNLTKKFGNFTALNGVSLDVKVGEVHALLGDNGAGKSTLIKTLAGVHQPSDGEILIEANLFIFAVRVIALMLVLVSCTRTWRSTHWQV